MVMVVSTRAIEGEYRTRDMYGWADGLPDEDGDKVITVTEGGQTFRRKPTKHDRAKAKRAAKLAAIDKVLAKRAKHRTNTERRAKMLKKKGLAE